MKRKQFDLKRSFNNATASWNLVKITKYFVGFGVLILLASSYVWFTRLYMTNERRFWSAVENSMATPSVVRTLTEGGTGNLVVQDYRFHFAPERVIENRVEFTQKSATVDTQVITEGVIYPEDQFLRYTKFINKSEGSFDENIDEVLGKWAHQSSTDGEEGRLNYLSEYVTLAIFGNYSPSARGELVSRLTDNQIYQVDYQNAIEDTLDGEKVLRFGVAVNLREYAALLNDAFVKAGYGDFPPLNPDNYQEGSTLNSQFVVRKRDNVLVGINFGGREEAYSNYGVVKTVATPEAELSIDELQNTVQTLLQ